MPAHPVPSDVYPTLISLWTVCQVTAFHLACPICSYQWCNSLKFKSLVGKQSGRIAISDLTHIAGLSMFRMNNMFCICFADICKQGWKNKVQAWFSAKQICLTLPTQHQLGLFSQLTAFIVCVGLKWSHIKGLCLCRVDSLVVCTAQQEDSYLSQLLTAASQPK